MASKIVPRMDGRPHTMTMQPELKEPFLEYLKEGMSVKEASALIGIDGRSAYNWIKRGMQDYKAGNFTTLAEFALDCNKALNEAKHIRVLAISKAMRNPAFWQAAAWWLERRYPEEFGRQDRVNMNLRAEVQALNTRNIEVNEDEANAFRSLIAKAGLSETDDGETDGAGFGVSDAEFDIPIS